MPQDSADPESNRAGPMRFDDWPVQQFETWENWQVAHETPVETPGDQRVDDVEWLGFAGGASGGAILYDPQESAVYRAEVDEDDERVVVRDRESTDADDEFGGDVEELLADRLETIGDEHGWTWLSGFAREHLDDADAIGYRTPAGFDHEYSEFQQRNVLEDADPDVGFFGAHVFSDDFGREHTIERDFDVSVADDGESAAVHVAERSLLSEATEPVDRDDGAELVDEREYDLRVDVGDGPADRRAEQRLTEWHDEHLAPPVERP